MVKLHIKRGSDDLFLFDTSVTTPIVILIKELVKIHNGRLKIARLCAEIEELADHGVALPSNMVGLAQEQIEELGLQDPSTKTHIPSGGAQYKPDEMSKRNGHSPNEEMAQLLKETAKEVKEAIHRNQIHHEKALTYSHIKDQFMKLKGAVTIVYPMGIPLHDPLHVELTCMETENLDSGNGGYREVLQPETTTLWWAGKELKSDRLLRDYIGGNEKTKAVIKLAVLGAGAPGREPIFTEEQKKVMMLHAFHRQQEIEKLTADDDDGYLNSQWADNKALKRCFQDIKDIKFSPL